MRDAWCLDWFVTQRSQFGIWGWRVMFHKAQVVLRRVTKTLLLAVNAVWAVPVVLILRAIRPLVHVRMGVLLSSRIGHFITDASLFLVRGDVRLKNERAIDLFCFSDRPCNQQWARMVRRKLRVHWWVKYLVLINRFIPGGGPYDLVDPTLSANRNIYNVLNQSSARFEFTQEEENKAKSWLRRQGWQDGEHFVCLFIRDSAYLGNDAHWSYHNYRDSDIDSYTESVQKLVDKNYWVIRMGKTAHRPLSLKQPRVIDYPFAQDRDDLLDIWLPINCHFLVATGSGIDTLPWIYGKPPIAYVNAMPLAHCATPINNIWSPKTLRWQRSGDLLTLKEYCLHCYFRSEEYESAGIAIEDLSPSEITSAVMECEQRVAGTWEETDEDKNRQRRFWDALRKWPEFHKYHGDVHPEARVGCAWLKSMGDSFFD